MSKINKHIEIVRSSKTWFSSIGGPSCDAIFKVLNKTFSSVGISIVDDFNDLKVLVELRPDLVFLGMKFIPEEHTVYSQHSAKVWIADYLDEAGIAYTGSGRIAHELEMNKPLAKQRVLDAGVSTSPFMVINQVQTLANYTLPSDLGFPLFVKPTNRGGGLGIDSKSVVNNQKELEAKVESIARKLKSDSLIEKYLVGREFSVAIFDGLKPLASYTAMPIELVTLPDAYGSRLLSGKVKSENGEDVSIIDDPILKSIICDFALRAFNALGGRDYGRIDIRLDEFGKPQFLEANLIPSLIDNYGSFPKACYVNMGIEFEPMILNIVNLALMRSSETNFKLTNPIDIDDDILISNNVVYV